MSELKPKAKIGRPPKIIGDEQTLKSLAGLGRIQATTKEAACFFSVTEKTFIEFLQRDEKGRDAFENGKGLGRVSLRRWQFQNAEKGNVTMQIWLGKQHLDQRDKSELTGKNGGPIETREVRDLSDDELANIALRGSPGASKAPGSSKVAH